MLIFAEIILVFAALFLLLAGVFKTKSVYSFVYYGGLITLGIYGLTAFVLTPTGALFNGAFVHDEFAQFAKLLIAGGAIASLLLSQEFFAYKKLEQYEFIVLILFAVLGMSVMVSAGHLLTLYIGLEMQSLSLYVLACFDRNSARSSEAGLKYFVLGALSSGLLLYGISLIYGFSGTFSYEGIAQYLQTNLTLNTGADVGMMAGLTFVLCGLAFKISASPFHMWTPDVYEGAPTPVTAFFAGIPKFAALILIARFINVPFAAMADVWQQVIIIVAVLSMAFGSIGALMQQNIKRLLAYSSITNMGYALVGLSVSGVAGVSAMLTFMAIYLITVIGVFACVLHMQTQHGYVEKISSLSGLAHTQMPLALIFSALLFSLAGIPVFVGFFAKWFVFLPAIQSGLAWLVVIALLSSVVSAFYYLRIVKTIWFAAPTSGFSKISTPVSVIARLSALCVFPVLLLPFIAEPSLVFINAVSQSLFK